MWVWLDTLIYIRKCNNGWKCEKLGLNLHVANAINYYWKLYLTEKRVNNWDLFMQIYLVKFKDYSSVNNCGYYV